MKIKEDEGGKGDNGKQEKGTRNEKEDKTDTLRVVGPPTFKKNQRQSNHSKKHTSRRGRARFSSDPPYSSKRRFARGFRNELKR
jgi:hypothetical protein